MRAAARDAAEGGRGTARFRAFGFGAAALVFAVGAAVHAVALVRPDVLEPSPPYRHALFVVVNAGFALAFVRRPPWLPALFAVLLAQQLFSHGQSALDLMAREKRVDAASVLVFVGLPLIFALLVWDARARRREKG
jgi:hypothetical protein